ncbi:MAG: GtrA family protein [Anaerolineae bacterium]|nr:GtrA family protein [Anaerolineae bacterium]
MIQRLIDFLTHLRTNLHQNSETGRFARFLLVGVTGTALDFVLLSLLKLWGGLPTLIANTISYSAGIVNNFTFNRLWTFRDSTNTNILGQFAQYFTINIGGLLVNNFLIWVFEPIFASLMADNLAYLPAKVIASLVAVSLNFVLNRYITFRDVGAPGQSTDQAAGHDPVTPGSDTISKTSSGEVT